MALTIDLDQVLLNSYADFHAKGFDYLCLHRSPELTIKAYFFEGDVATAPEVVVPHDHRYGFTTQVLAGESINRRYQPVTEQEPGAKPYEAFDYLTVLNGGNGFTWRQSVWLREKAVTPYVRGGGYASFCEDIHTIQILAPETALLLLQGPDKVPVGVPTTAYRPDGMREPPSLSGLYREMDEDHAVARLNLLERMAPGLIAGLSVAA
jgi:hypothetical protein